MKLLVDIGNTRVKWATLEKGGLIESHHFTRKKTTIKSSLTSEWKALKDIESIHVSNVAGDKIGQQLTEWTEKKWQLTPSFVKSEAKRFGVTNSYSDPELLGVDRWLAIIAARQHARQATCIIDCGTAITIDIVTKYGLHQGGMILPGLSLMREALGDNTNMSANAEISDFKTLAVNTQSAIQAGTLYTVSASLERLIDDLTAQFDNRIRFIITGGDAEIILPLINASISHYPDIVLKGLAYYARQGDRKPYHSQQTEAVEAVEAVEA
jgi:type III pantothenate kinase